MGKKVFTNEWYRLDKIFRYNASYSVVIGERSNGKTYAGKEYIIERAKFDEQFVYLRRRHTHIVRSKMMKLFEDITVKSESILRDYIKYKNDIGFYINTEEGEKTIGYAASVEDAYLLKGIPYEKVTTILFDEFLDYEYMEDEITKFLHIISTIVRDRKNVKIIMLANTVSRFSPYFELFGIDIKKIKQGQIGYIVHKSGATVAIEYCATHSFENSREKKHNYVGFDNNDTVNMILYGEWEYQHTNIKDIDGIGWSCKNRILLPLYLTALGEVYEMTLYTNTQIPICFVRKINTQRGEVSKKIKLNLNYDDSLSLVNSYGIVPSVKKINELVDEKTRGILKIFNLAFSAGRIVFDSVATGSDFTRIFTEIIK